MAEDAEQGAHQDEYHDGMVELLELVWGKGFLSPGGPDNVKETVAGLDLADKLVLDIGCGWGAMAFHLAETADVAVLGVTLSKDQHALATARAAARGLADRVRFELMDYRDVTGSFDRIVSVGMFEHVGVGHYPAYFAKVDALLKDDGVALIHSIGRLGGPGATSAWLRKYIFPGAYAPALSEVTVAVEPSGLVVTDVELSPIHISEPTRRTPISYAGLCWKKHTTCPLA